MPDIGLHEMRDRRGPRPARRADSPRSTRGTVSPHPLPEDRPIRQLPGPACAALLVLPCLPAIAAPASSASAKRDRPALTILVKGEPAIRVEDRKVTLLPEMTEWRVRKLMGPPDAWRYNRGKVSRHFDYRAHGLRVTLSGETVLTFEIFLLPKEVDTCYKALYATFSKPVTRPVTPQGHGERYLAGFAPAPARFAVNIAPGTTMTAVEKALPRRRISEKRVLRYRFDEGRGDLTFVFNEGRLGECSISR